MDKLRQFLIEYGSEKEESFQLSDLPSVPVQFKSEEAIPNHKNEPSHQKEVIKSNDMKTKITFGLLTNEELMDFLKCTARTIANYRKKGILPFTKFGGKIYYKEEDIHRLFGERA